MSNGMVEMPVGLSHEQQDIWIQGFHAGLNWMYKNVLGQDQGLQLSDVHVLEIDNDGISDRPL